jgi:HSP20 family protein
MDIRTFLPTLPRTTSLRPQLHQEPVTGGYQEMSRVFEDMLTAMARAPWASAPLQALTMPRVEIAETDKEVSIDAELPGLSEKDVAVSLDDDVLTIRAEKKSESTSEPAGKRDYHLREREYGLLVRSFCLPFSPDPTQVEAVLHNGLLTIRVPKPQVVRERVRNIMVRSDETSASTQASDTDGGVEADGKSSGSPLKTTGASQHEKVPH